jgi:hypothetical protein
VTIRPWGAGLLAGLVLFGAGGAAGFLLRPAAAPSGLAEPEDHTSAPVTAEGYADERTVRVTFEVTPTSTLEIGLKGRVTTTRCAAGAELRSGEVAATIGAVPLIALATEIPLYRDLEEGDHGGDVQALQRELARLGYGTAEDGEYGPNTADAVDALLESAGVARPKGEVEADRFLWLPAATSVLDECQAPLGTTVAPGAPYGTVPGGLTGIRADSLPEGAVDGDRTMEVLGVEGPMGTDGAVTDRGFLDEVESTTRFAEVMAGDEAVTADVALTDPVDAHKVPPAAVFGVDGDRGCVESGDAVHPVRIVGSGLGATLVVVEGEAPEDVDLGPAIGAESCA